MRGVDGRGLTLCGAVGMMMAGGCGGGNGGGMTAGWAPTATTDNAATISGGSTGMCSGVTLLRKKIPLTLSAGGADFAIGDGYLFTDASTPQFVDFAVPVRNLGSTMNCFVHVSTGSYEWNTSQGSAPVELLQPYVTGSVGDVGSGIYSQSCLAPGETGILVDLEQSTDGSDLFTPMTSIALALETPLDGTAPPAALVPQSYADSGGALTVTFLNVGTGAGDIDNLGSYLVMDSGGLPTAWGFLNELPQGLLDVGQQGTGTADPLNCGSTVRAYIAFDSPTAAFAPSGLASPLAAAAASESAWRSSIQTKLSAIRAARGGSSRRGAQ